MTAHFEQTGVECCERCGMPRELARIESRCVIESDFSADGYPEPVGSHPGFVRLAPPAAPITYPLSFIMAEREREMAVLAEAIESERRVTREAILTCMNCGADLRPEDAIVVVVGLESELRGPCCQPNDETVSTVTHEELWAEKALRDADLVDSGRGHLVRTVR